MMPGFGFRLMYYRDYIIEWWGAVDAFVSDQAASPRAPAHLRSEHAPFHLYINSLLVFPYQIEATLD